MKNINSRTDLINFLINKISATKYLEIGVEGGINFSQVICKYKVGVDPDIESKATHFVTSNEFFSKNQEKFDVIFIDGLHHCDQVYLDIKNSLKILNKNGFIICDDLNPWDEHLQVVPRKQLLWTGDCWKSWVKLRFENLNLNLRTVNIWSGCGVISLEKTTTPPNIDLPNDPFELSYSFLEQYRGELLNLKSIEQFLEEMNYDDPQLR